MPQGVKKWQFFGVNFTSVQKYGNQNQGEQEPFLQVFSGVIRGQKRFSVCGFVLLGAMPVPSAASTSNEQDWSCRSIWDLWWCQGGVGCIWR